MSGFRVQVSTAVKPSNWSARGPRRFEFRGTAPPPHSMMHEPARDIVYDGLVLLLGCNSYIAVHHVVITRINMASFADYNAMLFQDLAGIFGDSSDRRNGVDRTNFDAETCFQQTNAKEEEF